MIVSLMNTKGGVGKSTDVLLLAFSLTFGKFFKRIAVVDLDEQGSLDDFFADRDPEKQKKGKVDFFYLGKSTDNEIEETLIKIADSHDLVIMDIPGESVPKFATNLALHISSLVLLPLCGSTKDEKAFTKELLPVIAPVLSERPFYVLPSQIHSQTKPENVFNYFRAWLPDEIGCTPYFISYRGVYRFFDDDGLTLLEYVKSVKGNKKIFTPAHNAAREVEVVAKNIVTIIKGIENEKTTS